MKKYNKVTPEGTKDLLLEECLIHREIERRLGEVFSSRGFHEVVTPGLEFMDVFEPEVSGISPEVMYKTTDRRGRLIAMRPDSTMPIARLAATRLQNQEKPIRLYYTQRIYRSNPNLTGRSDEVLQSGVELLGAAGKRADLEAIATAVEALSRCLPDFRLELGHAGFFRAIAAQLPISPEEREKIRSTIESKNYAALNTMLDALEQTPSVTAMRRLPRLFGGEEVFAQAAPLCGSSQAEEMLGYLHDLYGSLVKLGLGDRLMVDLGLVQRNDYYTGVVFSAYAEDCGDAVLLGGRYDNLLSCFDMPMPAIGFSVNVDAVAKLLGERGFTPPLPRPEVLIFGEDGYEMKALLFASGITGQGGSCETSVFSTEEETMDFARRRGIPRVAVVGEHVREIRLSPKNEEGGEA
ncbi:MAG TPA: ATP phosphoribosyltransferase regulatory subunit [Candidatus Caccousia avistercoris]|nr:ATP phosphoribosyltransferase regulatory subunit [Candidatus Caccousia avistercoris]